MGHSSRVGGMEGLGAERESARERERRRKKKLSRHKLRLHKISRSSNKTAGKGNLNTSFSLFLMSLPEIGMDGG